VKPRLHVAKKNGAIPPHRKHLENSMTELSGSIADIFLHTNSSSALVTSHLTPTSQFIVELKQAIVSAWQQLSQTFIDKTISKRRRRLKCVVQ